MTSVGIVLSVFTLDRLSKIWAVQALDFQGTPVWPGVFHLTLVHNTGVAFGMFRGAGRLLALTSLLSAAVILAYLGASARRAQPSHRVRRWAWAAVAGGALGNAYDRLRFGAVIDFLDFRVWPVFNLADSAIVCGAAVVAYSVWRQRSVKA